MKRLAILLGALACGHAQAGELLVHGLSHHMPNTYEHTTTTRFVDEAGNEVGKEEKVQRRHFNNINYGLGWKTDSNYAFGIYRNSYGHTSVYAAKMFLWDTTPDLQLGVMVGLVTGYETAVGRPVTIGGGFQARYKLNERYALYVTALPRVGEITGMVNLTMGRRF